MTTDKGLRTEDTMVGFRKTRRTSFTKNDEIAATTTTTTTTIQ